jgi:hypothetical protein
VFQNYLVDNRVDQSALTSDVGQSHLADEFLQMDNEQTMTGEELRGHMR